MSKEQTAMTSETYEQTKKRVLAKWRKTKSIPTDEVPYLVDALQEHADEAERLLGLLVNSPGRALDPNLEHDARAFLEAKP